MICQIIILPELRKHFAVFDVLMLDNNNTTVYWQFQCQVLCQLILTIFLARQVRYYSQCPLLTSEKVKAWIKWFAKNHTFKWQSDRTVHQTRQEAMSPGWLQNQEHSIYRTKELKWPLEDFTNQESTWIKPGFCESLYGLIQDNQFVCKYDIPLVL